MKKYDNMQIKVQKYKDGKLLTKIVIQIIFNANYQQNHL